MKVKVNKDKCIGCGQCINIAPEVFEFDEDHKSKVKDGADLEKSRKEIEEAKGSCPMGAIEVED